MSALIDTERPQYYETLVDAGFTEKQARMQILVMQDLSRQYDDASRNTLPSKGDVQDVQLEIQKVRADTKVEIEKIRADMTVQLEKVRADVGKNQVEVEKVRGEVEKVRAEVEKVRAEVEKVRAEVVKVRAELKVDIEKVRNDLTLDIAKVRSEVEKVRAELKVDMKALEVRLLRWQIGIGVALVAVMAKGFHWLGF